MDGKCTFGNRCNYSHKPTEEEKQDFRNKNKAISSKRDYHEGGFNKNSDKQDKNEIGELVNNFEHLSKQMHFLGEAIQKISRFNVKRGKM